MFTKSKFLSKKYTGHSFYKEHKSDSLKNDLDKKYKELDKIHELTFSFVSKMSHGK